MAVITFKGNEIHTIGELPDLEATLPDFTLTGADLSDTSLADYGDKVKILSIVPSLDTSVCAQSAISFSREIEGLDNAVLLNISADLPFASGRFCESNGIKNVETLSTFRSPSFGKDYGVEITDGPLRGLMSRAVIVADGSNRILYHEQVPEIAQEPDYNAALDAARAAS